MTDKEYQDAMKAIVGHVLNGRFEDAVLLRDAIQDAGRRVPVLGHDDESPEMALMHQVYADMLKGVAATDSAALDELIHTVEQQVKPPSIDEPGVN